MQRSALLLFLVLFLMGLFGEAYLLWAGSGGGSNRVSSKGYSSSPSYSYEPKSSGAGSKQSASTKARLQEKYSGTKVVEYKGRPQPAGKGITKESALPLPDKVELVNGKIPPSRTIEGLLR